MFPMELGGEVNHEETRVMGYSAMKVAWSIPSTDFYLQRVSIACYADRCISYGVFCPSDRLTICPAHAGIMPKRLQLAYDHAVLTEDYSPMTLVSWRLTSARNSKGNIGSEGAEWEWGSKNRQFLAFKSPYLRNGAI